MKALGRELRRFLVCLCDGVSLFWLAPAIPLLAAVFEFAQHVVEIRIGLLASRDSFDALAFDPQRMAFGYPKIAAVWLSMLLASRVWANRAAGRAWWSFATVAWRPFCLGLALTLILSIPMLPGLGLPPAIYLAVSLVTLLATIPVMVLVMAGLLGDRDATLAGVFRHGWGKGLRIFAFAMLAAVPLQILHQADHVWAFGKAAPVVWALMTFDALLVGAMAAIVGTAVHHGYAPPDL